jgi:glyoxylase-like metal-dependent hydrolase (beta-lactamase superfamily II)
LVDPSRLEASARKVFGADFDRFFGALTPIPEANISIASGEAVGWEVFPAPGHASHHVCYFKDGTLLAGDSCGVRLLPSEYIVPAAPPPDIDLEAWRSTLAEIRRHNPERIALIHFGVVTEPGTHLERMGSELERWAELVRNGLDADEFVAEVSKGAGAELKEYEIAAPFDATWRGLRRYWVKRGELPES